MAFNLAGIANAFREFARGVGIDGALGINTTESSQLYPESASLKKVQNSINASAWNKLPFPYTFSIRSITDNKVSPLFRNFALTLAPTEITQSEIPATSIKPTQGGTVTNHGGIKYKMLNISGTTGISPFRGMAGVDKSTGQVIAKPDDLKYKSGHTVFLELRNWLKTYYKYKADTKTSEARNLRLVWQNFKDGEFLIVELLKFDMKRTAEESFLYRYDISLKVIGTIGFEPAQLSSFQPFEERINRAVEILDTARGTFLASQELLRTVESAYNSTIIEPLRKISLAAKAFAGIGITAADVGNRIIKNTITAAGALDILGTISDQIKASKTGSDANIPQSIQNASVPVDLRAATANSGSDLVVDLNEALLDMNVEDLPESTNTAMLEETREASNLQRSFYSDAVKDMRRIQANAEDAFNLGSGTYDALFNRTSTLNAESTKQTTLNEFEVLDAMNQSIIAINLLISSKELFKSDFKSRTDSIQASFDDQLGLEALPAVETYVMPGNTDLEQVALDLLGDPIKWVEIAELNNLQAPYVVQDLSDTRTNVVRPGEEILVPRNIVNGFSEKPIGVINKLTAGLNEVERSLNVDLKMSDTFDLIINNGGDLELIAGLDNMAQAVVLKLGYETGELRNHPRLGIGVQVGSKFNSLEEIRDRLLESLTQDERVDNVTDLSLVRDGSALFMSFNLNIKLVDKPVPIKVKL